MTANDLIASDLICLRVMKFVFMFMKPPEQSQESREYCAIDEPKRNRLEKV